MPEPKHTWAPLSALLGTFTVLVAPVLLVQRGGTAGAKDQEVFHLPMIRRYAEDLPNVVLDGHNGAMSPGYQLLLATVRTATGADRVGLQVVTLLLSLALLVVVFRLAARFVDGWTAFALTLPFACSHYVVQAGGWLITDNLALLFVVLALAASLAIVRGENRFVAASLATLAAVWVRQIHLWMAGAVVLAGLLAPGRPLGRAAAAVVAPVLGLAVLVAVWGGLTPPAYEGEATFRPSAVAFTLALFGVFGGAYLLAGGWSPLAMARSLLGDRVALAAGAAGALSALVVPTAESEADGRTGGGLWVAVGRAPAVADRSLLLAALATVGALVAVAWWRTHREGGRRAETQVLLGALACFVAAHTVAPDVYQRYFEPPILIVCLLLCAMHLGRAGAPGRSRRRALLVLGLLTAFQLAGVAVEVYRSMGQAPAIERSYPGVPDIAPRDPA